MKIPVYDDNYNVVARIEYNSILEDHFDRIGKPRIHKGLTRLEGEGRYAEIMGFYYEYATLIGLTRAQELIYENKNKNDLLKKFPELKK